MVWEEMSFENFQDGRHGNHFGYRNGMILTILYKPPYGPNAIHQFWAQSDLGFPRRCGLKIFKMDAEAAILDSQM